MEVACRMVTSRFASTKLFSILLEELWWMRGIKSFPKHLACWQWVLLPQSICQLASSAKSPSARTSIQNTSQKRHVFVPSHGSHPPETALSGIAPNVWTGFSGVQGRMGFCPTATELDLRILQPDASAHAAKEVEATLA